MAEYSVITPFIREAFRKMSASVSKKKRMTEKRGPREAFRKMTASVSKKKKKDRKKGTKGPTKMWFLFMCNSFYKNSVQSVTSAESFSE